MTAINKVKANNIATPTEYKYCLKKFLESSIWCDSSKPENIALTPFAVKIIDKIKTEDSKPPLGLF